MPTYIVSAAANRLTKQVKQEIASLITESHSGATSQAMLATSGSIAN
ncbi:hypothetical protein WN982_11020 [Paraburkholderia sp. IMGN_8]